jgi:hypothetical protein
MRSPKANYTIIKEEYLANENVTLKSLADKFGCGYSALLRRSMKEGWSKEKETLFGRMKEQVIEEAEGSVKDMIKRHSKMARYLQGAGVKYLKLLLDEVEILMRGKDEEGARKVLKSLIFNKIITASNLESMLSEGLKAERELYPKQMQVDLDATVEGEGLSPELTEVVYDALRAKLGRKRASIHRSKSNKKPIKK